jgi:GNAT superfamily N-acetyltransferase
VHCVDEWQATQDVFYVSPEYRGGMVGTRLIRLAEEHFAVMGIHLVFNHTNLKDMKLGHLLEFLGYEPISIIYQKRISKCHQQS